MPLQHVQPYETFVRGPGRIDLSPDKSLTEKEKQDSETGQQTDPTTRSIYGISSLLNQARMSMFGGITGVLQGSEKVARALWSWAQKNEGWDPNLLSVTLLIMLRETQFGNVFNQLRPENWAEETRNKHAKNATVPAWSPVYPGKKLGDNSVGLAQIKPSTAQKFGVDMKKYLSSVEGAIDETYKLVQKYHDALKNFYQGPEVTIRDENNAYRKIPGINNSALNTAILIAHNAGLDWVNKKWCQTDNPKFAGSCDSTTYKPFKDKNLVVKVHQNKPLQNFIPEVKNSAGAGTYSYLVKSGDITQASKFLFKIPQQLPKKTSTGGFSRA
jgi:hypothetical protein